MSNVWYTSDLHIGHKMVSELRGFKKPVEAIGPNGLDTFLGPDPDAHDAHVAAVWDSLVKPSDTVWVLGDISINGGQHALDWFEQRPGTKHLIAGNHDPVGPWDRRAHTKLPLWLKYFETIQPYARRKLDGIEFFLSHFPYWPYDRGEPRYEQYRVTNLGRPLVHGHTHSDQVFEFPGHFHVGWDAHGTLVPQERIMNWLSGKREVLS